MHGNAVGGLWCQFVKIGLAGFRLRAMASLLPAPGRALKPPARQGAEANTWSRRQGLNVSAWAGFCATMWDIDV
jgi:hypothetical protein